MELHKPPEKDELLSYLEVILTPSQSQQCNIDINEKVFTTLVDMLPTDMGDIVKTSLPYMNKLQYIIVMVCCAILEVFHDTNVQYMKRIMNISQELLGNVISYPLHYSSGKDFYDNGLDSLIKLLDASNDCARPREISYCQQETKVIFFTIVKKYLVDVKDFCNV